ncbi:MAG: hypothetical protein WEB05_04855 [Solirubrobacterales bacterium]
MSEKPEKQASNRIPLGAIATVLFGLIVTLMVVAVDFKSDDFGRSGESTEWIAVESIATAAPVTLGETGSFGLARTTIAAIAPVESGQLLFRVAGAVEIDSGNGIKPAKVRCDIRSPAEGSLIARTPQRRASWPRPAVDLRTQPVPEELVVRFSRDGKAILGLPVRDSFRQFTDSASPSRVAWEGYIDKSQNLTWTMPRGTGQGGAALTFMVVFKSSARPRAEISCTGTSGSATQQVRLSPVLQEWPLVDPASDLAFDTTETPSDGE